MSNPRGGESLYTGGRTLAMSASLSVAIKSLNPNSVTRSSEDSVNGEGALLVALVAGALEVCALLRTCLVYMRQTVSMNICPL